MPTLAAEASGVSETPIAWLRRGIRPAASGPDMPSRGLALGPGSNSLFPTLKDPWGRQPLRHRRSRHNARHSRSGTASP